MSDSNFDFKPNSETENQCSDGSVLTCQQKCAPCFSIPGSLSPSLLCGLLRDNLCSLLDQESYPPGWLSVLMFALICHFYEPPPPRSPQIRLLSEPGQVALWTDQDAFEPERIRLRLLTWNIFCEPWWIPFNLLCCNHWQWRVWADFNQLSAGLS